jgi:hypothetical protein
MRQARCQLSGLGLYERRRVQVARRMKKQRVLRLSRLCPRGCGAQDRRSLQDRVVDDFELRVTVDGWPPAKNEAKSMLAAGHTHSGRVLGLLEAVRAAVEGRVSPTFANELVGLELVVRSPVEPPADATNFLGGIGDVLEAKNRRGVLEHLGDLPRVALYANDRQIQAVTYRWERANAVSYSVRIWRL